MSAMSRMALKAEESGMTRAQRVRAFRRVIEKAMTGACQPDAISEFYGIEDVSGYVMQEAGKMLLSAMMQLGLSPDEFAREMVRAMTIEGEKLAEVLPYMVTPVAYDELVFAEEAMDLC